MRFRFLLYATLLGFSLSAFTQDDEAEDLYGDMNASQPAEHNEGNDANPLYNSPGGGGGGWWRGSGGSGGGGFWRGWFGGSTPSRPIGPLPGSEDYDINRQQDLMQRRGIDHNIGIFRWPWSKPQQPADPPPQAPQASPRAGPPPDTSGGGHAVGGGAPN